MNDVTVQVRNRPQASRWTVFRPLLAAAGLLVLWGCSAQTTPEEDYQLGRQDLQRGRLEQGLIRIEAALAQAPEASFAADALNWLGLASRELNRPEEALRYFEQAVQRAPDSFEPSYNLGTMLLESGDSAKGIRLLRTLADRHPNDTRTLFQIAEWTTRNGRIDLAIRMYQEAQKREPRSAMASAGLGRAAMLEGRLDEAEAAFLKVLDWQSNDAVALYNLGVLHAQSEGGMPKAREFFRRYLQAFPKGARAGAASMRLKTDEATSTAAGPGVAMDFWRQAQAAHRAGDAPRATHQVEAALAAARESGRLDQTGEILRGASGMLPGNLELHRVLAHHWMAQQMPARAQDLLRQAQALDPENADVLLDMVAASKELEEFDTAVLALRQLVLLQPRNPDVFWMLAEGYGDDLGMAEHGIRLFNEFRARFPEDPRVNDVETRVQRLREAAPPPALPGL